MKFTKEQIMKAAACKTTDELIALAKGEGMDLTLEDAQKYLAQFAGTELKLDDIDAIAGGAVCAAYGCGGDCPSCTMDGGPCMAYA